MKTTNNDYNSAHVDEAEERDFQVASDVREGRAYSSTNRWGTITNCTYILPDGTDPSEPSGP